MYRIGFGCQGGPKSTGTEIFIIIYFNVGHAPLSKSLSRVCCCIENTQKLYKMSEQEQKLAQLVAEKNDLESLNSHPMATKLLQDGKDGDLC